MAHLVIDRSKISPEWDAATKLLYLWLCEEAAFSPHEWRGVTVGAGQYLTTLRELAEVFNCSYETIRSRLKKISEFQSVNVQTIKTKGGKYGVNSLTLITLNRTTSNKSADLTADLTATGQPTKSNLNSYDDYQVDSLTADLTADLTLSRNKGITEIKGTETSSSSPNTRAHAYTHEGQAEADETAGYILKLKDTTAKIKELEAVASELKDHIATAFGDAERLAIGDDTWATYKTQHSQRLDTKKLKADHPEIYEAYCKDSSTRVLRIK